MRNKATMFATAGALAALISTPVFAQQQQYDGARHGRRDQQTQQTQQPQQNQWQQTQRQRQPQQVQQSQQQAYQPQQAQWQRQAQPAENRSYSRNDNDNNQRTSVSGRVTSYSRERGGYRVQLDRGRESYYIPEARLGGRGLSVGLNLSLGGISSYGSGYLSGVVESVDYRDGLATLRDDASRRIVEVNLRGNVQQLHSGDFVTLEGQWDRSNIFDAYRIDDVR
jgi:DNA mismatch repair ATPase MutL